MPIPLEQADFSVPPPQILSYFPALPVKEPLSAEVNRKKKGIAEVANTAKSKSSSKKEEHGKQPTPKSSEDGKVANLSAKYMEESILCAIVPNEQKVEPKPLLPKQTAAKKRFLRPSAFPNPGEKVTISHVEDSTIYIYGVGHGLNGSPSPYIEYMKCMMKAARETKEHLSKPPELGDIVFAPLESVYYRAVVKSIDGANVKVIFPEFGNSATVDWKMFKVINDLNIKYARCMTYEVSIENVPQFTKLMYEFLKKLIDTEEFEISKVFNLPNTHIKMVDLLHRFENYVLSKKLLSLLKNETNEKDTVKEGTKPALKQLAAYFPDSNMPIFFDEVRHLLHEMSKNE
ncbi:uncharacterized protein LOC131284697 [Anopheles ziemanni]|uniref:uncharacterized protein LOC131284697 n=1 Tax=Anopheles ziemanni TaxID=345580 RepID=UPI00265F0931|nr:uncharacterized protein LOC131284697 [Anopheles ziemanni]